MRVKAPHPGVIDLRVAKFQKPRVGAAEALVLVHLEQLQRIPCHVLFLLCSESGASWLKKKQQPSPVPVRLTVIPEKIPGGVTFLRLQARTASLLSTQERKNAKAMLPHFLPTSFPLLRNSHTRFIAVLPSHTAVALPGWESI